MQKIAQNYINGEWIKSRGETIDVVNPSTEQTCAKLVLGSEVDLTEAIAAAKSAFPSFSRTSIKERAQMLDSITHAFEKHVEDLADAITREMGCPISLSRAAQVPTGPMHMQLTKQALEAFSFDQANGNSHLYFEPIGVVGMITPWNWPINQISAKVAPAIAAGCTMVLKPSEVTPSCAEIFAQIIDDAGIPAGVFNMVQGDGPTIGVQMSADPHIDMMSFTGSTGAGVNVAQNAAETVKRVHQELGGKSPNIILPDVDLEAAVTAGVQNLVGNSGQSCNAPTRMLVPQADIEKVIAIARKIAESVVVDDPQKEGHHIGPVSSRRQFEKVQDLIKSGIRAGATLVAGGMGRPEGLHQGFYVKPTIFANVNSEMRIAREEIFGPVLSILTYKDEEQAIEIANDTPYGLSAYIWSTTQEEATRVSRQIKAGNVHVNGAGFDPNSPFGGYKQSGNGREFGKFGIEEFLEVKSVIGNVA